LNRDPLGEFGSRNLFRSFGNDPNENIDPEGDSDYNTWSFITAPPDSHFNPYASWDPMAPGGRISVPTSVLLNPSSSASPPPDSLTSWQNPWDPNDQILGTLGAPGLQGTALGHQQAEIAAMVITLPLGANCPGKTPFAMGLKGELDAFAEARGATTWKQFSNPETWKPQVLERLGDPQTPVHFNLNGVDVWEGVQRASQGKGGATDWELLQIKQNPEFWDTITFWKDGKVAPNPFK
jgi:hypothetical protein